MLSLFFEGLCRLFAGVERQAASAHKVDHFRIARVLGRSAVHCLPEKLQTAVGVFPFPLWRCCLVFRLGSGTWRNGTAGRALESSRGYDLLQPCTDSLSLSAAGSSLCPTTCLSGCRERRRQAAGSLDGTRMHSSRRRRRGPPLLGSVSCPHVALLCASSLLWLCGCCKVRVSRGDAGSAWHCTATASPLFCSCFCPIPACI